MGAVRCRWTPSLSRTDTRRNKHVQVLRGGLRAELQPLGLTLLQRAASIAATPSCSFWITTVRVHAPTLRLRACGQEPHGAAGACQDSDGHHQSAHSGRLDRVRERQDEANPQAATTAILWLQEHDIASNGCVCMLTSGSVGEPKVVPCTWDHMLLQGESTHQQLFPNVRHASSVARPSLTPSLLTLYSRCTRLRTTRNRNSASPPAPELFTQLYATPGTYTALAAMPPTALYTDVPYCAGTRLSLQLFRTMRDEYGLLLMQNYGSTEMGDMAAWYLHGKSLTKS
ncbi:hypothetical protein GQ600_24812 [Phytophthora cactorum]|nr:hypothetical protein GQ600_24812 [Phytophthora cactorum]